MSKLTDRIQAARTAGRTALVPYLPAGFPDKARFFDQLKQLDDSGADVIEIGVPFSDPVADGPVIEAACNQCLEQGVTLGWILSELKARKGQFASGIVLMGYSNPFVQYGLEQFATDAAEAGVSGIIVPDLPLEEGAEFQVILAARNIDLVWLIGLNTPMGRMQAYAATARGFVYLVSVMGVTGERDALPAAVAAKLAEAKSVFTVPVALGFGLKTPSQLEPVKDLADAAVIGSALVRHIAGGGEAREFMAGWR